ncbi:hypothetical protein EMEDMD4_150055 [Sinorhizobium medicae]|uniref:Uncharacterized protein n=1 Tax=Sinorhizobium medicae TaxID=110321 RepID=A0A508WSB3_9HYPH|nr:hypothetical protein EMEDMD4_150055 [Sinorhizobium medicae]
MRSQRVHASAPDGGRFPEAGVTKAITLWPVGLKAHSIDRAKLSQGSHELLARLCGVVEHR